MVLLLNPTAGSQVCIILKLTQKVDFEGHYSILCWPHGLGFLGEVRIFKEDQIIDVIIKYPFFFNF